MQGALDDSGQTGDGQYVTIKSIQVNQGPKQTLPDGSAAPLPIMIHLNENHTMSYVVIQFDESSGLGQLHSNTECQFEFAANYALWYSQNVMPTSAWSTPIQQIDEDKFVCTLQH